MTQPCREPVSPLEFEFEKYDFNKEQLKDIIYEEILFYHFPQKRKDYEEKLKKGESLYEHIIHNGNKNYVGLADPDRPRE
jgi:hypothetical protein